MYSLSLIKIQDKEISEKNHSNYSLNTLANSATLTLTGHLPKKRLESKEQEENNTKLRKATSIKKKKFSQRKLHG